MNARTDSDDRALRAEAAHWFSLRRSGDMSADEIAAFAVWLDEVPGAQQQLDRLQRQWDAIGLVADDPAILAVREHDLRRFNRPARVRTALAAIAAAVLAVTSIATFVQLGMPGWHRVTSKGELFRTGAGQRTVATLADGSIVTLDAESELRVVEMAARRRLQLVRGRAFFEVAKDPVHPFLVEAGGKTIRAVGTKFDVRLDSGSEVTVTLVEGKVRVEQSSGGWLEPVRQTDMVAGSRLVAGPDRNWNLSQVETGNDTSWLSGRLTFVREPLAKAIADVNRYSKRKIVFVDGPAPVNDIVGVFEAGDVDSFVTAMELNGIAHVVDRSDSEIRLARPAADAKPAAAGEPQGDALNH